MKSIEELYKEHLAKEPSKKYKLYDEDVHRGITTDEWHRWDFHRKRLKDLVDLGINKRDEILKVIKSGVKLGDVAEKFGLHINLILDVLYFNINKYHYLNKESI